VQVLHLARVHARGALDKQRGCAASTRDFKIRAVPGRGPRRAPPPRRGAHPRRS
jgi:hypothetical protein